ncbi:EamA family transporter [Chitinophaga sp. B61]|uniref:EamA family transporter n=2 Tax=Chitinophaga rhizophila TaxID=2866212 RepID=A0ABS7GEE0_9BACT|nr:EamA family transporter [Chitinophaga rhizophila]
MIGGTVGLGILMPVYLHFFPVARLVPDMKDTIYLLLLSLRCTVALYVIFAETLKKLSAFTVNLSFNLEPIYAIVIAFIFFAEGKEVNASFYVGLLFVAASVVLQAIISGRKN